MDNRRTLSIIAQGAGNTSRTNRSTSQNNNEGEEFIIDEPSGLPSEYLQPRRSSRVRRISLIGNE